jgi:hypothetical protein
MDNKRLKFILIGLKRYGLTFQERQFIERIEKYFNEKGVLTDQQESILEGIYKEKKWVGKTFFSQNNLPKGSSSRVA